MKKILLLFVFLFSIEVYAQNSKDSLYADSNRDKVFLKPFPLKAGEYFEIKYPDNQVLKLLEVINLEGQVLGKPLLLTKMGLYMPAVPKGDYYLKIYLSSDTLIKKIRLE